MFKCANLIICEIKAFNPLLPAASTKQQTTPKRKLSFKGIDKAPAPNKRRKMLTSLNFPFFPSMKYNSK